MAMILRGLCELLQLVFISYMCRFCHCNHCFLYRNASFAISLPSSAKFTSKNFRYVEVFVDIL